MIFQSPCSLSQGLVDAQKEVAGIVPKASPEAFFQRCQKLPWEFFAEIFKRFIAGVLPEAAPRFSSSWSSLRDRFGNVVVMDGSQLAPVARKLKILWNERATILPGTLFVIYDLFRGIPRQVHFSANAAQGEWPRALSALDLLEPDTLVLGDKLFGTAQCFQSLQERGLWGVVPQRSQLSIQVKKCLSKKAYAGGMVEESIVRAGKGKTAPVQELRRIRFKKGKSIFTLLTNVLDPERLSAEEVLQLYRSRWKIEQLFYDLKKTVHLNRVYASNPNAVGMQVYAAAMVYTALRIAQGDVAAQCDIEPERISSAKFFPRMGKAYLSHAIGSWTVDLVERMNPSQRLNQPDWRLAPWSSIALEHILVVKRTGKRRPPTKSNGRWKSFAHVTGGPEMARLT
jgi:hypothetical protein